MSMMVSFVLSFFPRDVLDEILNLIESVSEDFPSYFSIPISLYNQNVLLLVFGLWFPGVAARPHCHHDQLLVHNLKENKTIEIYK